MSGPKQSGLSWYLCGPANFTRNAAPLPYASFVDPTNDVLSNGETTRTVRVYGVQNATQVFLPAWSDTGGQDDLVWYAAIRIPGTDTWEATIDFSHHRPNGPEYGGYTVNVYLVGIDGNMIGYPALNHTFQRFPPSSAASVSVSNGVVTASGLWRKFGEGIPDRRPASSRRHRCGIAREIYSTWRDEHSLAFVGNYFEGFVLLEPEPPSGRVSGFTVFPISLVPRILEQTGCTVSPASDANRLKYRVLNSTYRAFNVRELRWVEEGAPNTSALLEPNILPEIIPLPQPPNCPDEERVPIP